MQDSNKIFINLITTKEELRQLVFNCLNSSDSNLILEKKENSEKEELLTIQQLADYFQVSTTTIHNWKNEGILPYVKIKSRIRFKKSVILAFDKKRRSKSKY